eukprot:TRINITY_DN28778_c0_g1_i1.p1 TRINITY_DN28778_c0_g1~~TRINITY_DN28778_c0_g1_i1.p1  ORF type:complete len:284 (+),score=43.46 TRINITY_DN28778_c0_g1_i1:117-968(+)
MRSLTAAACSLLSAAGASGFCVPFSAAREAAASALTRRPRAVLPVLGLQCGSPDSLRRCGFGAGMQHRRDLASSLPAMLQRRATSTDSSSPKSKETGGGAAPTLAFSWTVPNVLTVARLAMVPAMGASWFIARDPAITAAIFAAAAVTDALDGFIARTWPSQQSAWGAFMDPVADKVLVCCALFLVSSGPAVSPVVAGSSMVIVSREIAVSALREFGARSGTPIPVDRWGKAKTALQCVALFLLLCQYSDSTDNLGTLALVGASLLAVGSGWNYARPFMRRGA